VCHYGLLRQENAAADATAAAAVAVSTFVAVEHESSTTKGKKSIFEAFERKTETITAGSGGR
jgi:hypothetical protein